ncbi:hypothetical protein JCM8547_003408 [Rhodosporidiobolus lusitaniae]
MAAGNKRALPDDFDAVSRSPPRPPQQEPLASSSSSSRALVTSRGGYSGASIGDSAAAWAGELEERMAVDSQVGGDGRVVLEGDEAKDLITLLQETATSFLDTPATKQDIYALMQTIAQASSALAASPSSSRSLRRHRSSFPPSPSKPSVASTLPFDVIRLILSHLREIYIAEQKDEGETLFGGRNGEFSFWAELRKLARVSEGFKEACHSVYASELHIIDIKDLPSRAKTLAEKPKVAEALRVLAIRSFDFDYSFSRSTEDAGFAIPELIERARNLHTLSLSTDRASIFGAAGAHRNRRQRFETLTGGVSVPTLVSNLSSLRTLVYGAPCTLADVLTFTSIPTLVSLDVVGDVEHGTTPAIDFKHCSSSIRRLWLPSTALSAKNLRTLLIGDDDSTSRIDALAFTFDPEDSLNPTPPDDDGVLSEIAELVSGFKAVGGQLKELHIATPAADSPDRTANGVFGQIAIFTAVMPQGGQPAGAPGGGGAQNGPQVPPNRMGGGRRAGVAAGAGAAAGAGGAAGGGAGGVAGGSTAAPPHPPGAGGPAGAARRGGGLFGNLPGLGGGLFGNGPPQNANLQQLFQPPPPPPPTPFFEEVLAHTPNLELLELFGRRYSVELISLIKTLPLRHLALSVPVDSVREEVVNALLEVTKEGDCAGLRRLELSGRGGEWEASERRKVKQAADARGKLVYKSTDLKS